MAHELVPYTPSKTFLRRLARHGLRWGSPRHHDPQPNHQAAALLRSDQSPKSPSLIALLAPVLVLGWPQTPWAHSPVGTSPPMGLDWPAVVAFLLVFQVVVFLIALANTLIQFFLSDPGVPVEPSRPSESPSEESEIDLFEALMGSSIEAAGQADESDETDVHARVEQADVSEQTEPSGDLSSSKTTTSPQPDAAAQASPPLVGTWTPNSGALRLGGATRQGLIRSENQDAFRAGVLGPDKGLLVVCDGVGGHPGGGEAARFARDYLWQLIGVTHCLRPSLPDYLAKALEAAQIAFGCRDLDGLTTAIVVLIDGDRLHYAVLGDGDLVVIHPDGMRQSLLAPHHALDQPENVITAYLSANHSFTPRLGSVVLSPGSLVLAMTDGASDLLPLDQIAEQRHAYRSALKTQSVEDLCDQLLAAIESARDGSGAYLHSDNLTLAMAVVAGEAH